MTRDELEAEIRRALTKRDHMATAGNRTANDNAFVLMVLRAADNYALHVSGPNVAELQKSRRIELHRDSSLGRRP